MSAFGLTLALSRSMTERNHDHNNDREMPQDLVNADRLSETGRVLHAAGAKTNDARRGQVSGPPKDEPELNRAQADGDAAPDAVAEGGASDGDPVNTSDSSGLREDDEAAGALRKKQYRDGAGLVSSID